RHVLLLGASSDDDLWKLYHASDVVVLPALATIDDVEGFGITLLEAAAAGKPSVATRVGGIPDAVENGKSGILVEPDDYCGLARAIVSLLQNREKSLAMGELDGGESRKNSVGVKLAGVTKQFSMHRRESCVSAPSRFRVLF